MKKLLFTLFCVCLGSIAIAQETKETKFELNVGDTLVWQSFEKPGNIRYSVSDPKFIDYQIIGLGNELQIIAKNKGNAVVTAVFGEAQSLALIIVKSTEEPAPVVVIPKKPATQPFTAVYSFNPPADHFFITATNPGSDCRETYVKVGTKEAFNDGQGIDRIWDIKDGENWYYRPEAQGWTDDVRWEFEPLGESFFPLNTFALEVDKANLSNYYVGMERVLDVNCWHFFVENEEDGVIQYWVDPANGCTLKRQVNNEPAREVVVYDLKYTKLQFGPSFKKGLHDTRR